MYECAVADDLEMISFLRRAIPEARIPHQRHNNRAAVHKINGERLRKQYAT
jgi:hypothetical protein